MSRTSSQLAAFTTYLENDLRLSFESYNDFHDWCCDNPGSFWGGWLEYSGIPFTGKSQPALLGEDFLTRKFFPGVSLNYTRCLLHNNVSTVDAVSGEDNRAISVVDENGSVHSVSRQQLQEMALSIAAALQQMGIKPGDRVVAVARNSVESIAACLGTLAIGATWSSVAPELGITAVVERFQQLSPSVIFANTRFQMNGSQRSISANLAEIVEHIPSVQQLIVLSESDPEPELRCHIMAFSELLSHKALTLESLTDFPFDHPLFVMFSSGTTGKPKCIVHGAGGTLVEHLKEQRLHSDLSAKDTLLFQTSTGWMMWNWQLSALASGTHIVLYDGSVSYPEKWQLLNVIDHFGVTVFGTSPAYIQFLIESGIEPSKLHDFSRLRAIQSTGSVLYESQFEWITNCFKDVPVQSVSGGTDMIGCLVLGHPDLPVQSGDSQCISLGIDVRVLADDAVSHCGTGELVVTRPFPSQPVLFWNDDGQKQLKASYFDQNAGVWTHGDQVRITIERSPRILGRSDGTLNVRGVRIGPAEILAVVNRIAGVKESMVVEQASPREPGGSRLVMLLVMQNDRQLEREFVLKLKKQLAGETSRLHVPSVVVKVPALPRTHNGKLSEKAARDAVNRVSIANLSALANPELLNQLAELVPEAPK